MLKKKDKKARLWLVAVPCLLVVFWCMWQLTIRYEGGVPEIHFSDLPSAVGMSGKITFNTSDRNSGLQKIWVGLLQDGKEAVLLEKIFQKKGVLGGGEVKEFPVSILLEPKSSGISDGQATLRISVRDYSWRKWWKGNVTYLEKPLLIDTRSAQIEVLTNAHNITQGGAGLIVYRLSEACLKSGVKVGDSYFPGMSGFFHDPLVNICFFSLHHEQGTDTQLIVEAVDVAGNHSKAGFYNHLRKKRFKTDTINISDSFLDKKLPEFDVDTAGEKATSPIEQFLKVNRDLRKENFETIVRITSQSDNVMHWEGAFQRLPGSATRATFAESRTYLYNGEPVDHQTHLGIDLASVAHSPVPAANGGRVAFSGLIGIYGNSVIIDHGFGLFSLYSHLSSMSVQDGQMVRKGDIIGRTGTTGLAGGDHLHFSVLVHNTFVNPIEWWDGSWIENNISSKLIQDIAMAP